MSPLDDLRTFESDLLVKMSRALGLTYEQLTAKPRYSQAEREAIERSRTFYRRLAIEEAYWQAAQRRIWNNIVFSIFIQDSVEQIVGYNPQRLLPAS